MSLVFKNELMSCEKLSLIGFLNEIKDVNVGPHPRKFCFVLGAGASLTSGIKSGQELVNIWDNELAERNSEDYYKWKLELGITDENKYSFYSQYYEKRYARQPSDGYNYLEKLMEKARPSIGYVMLSYLLTQTNNNVVITTNFDHLIEDAVNYYAHTMPLVIGHESLAHYVTSQITRPTIIKIHRDLLFDPANRTDEVEELHGNWKDALNSIFKNYNPIFIGYAGNDNSLMDYLITNADKFSKNIFCPAYWMLYNKDKIEGKVREFLDNSHSYYIPHNGFDETIYRITDALGIKEPTKKELVEEAERRYQSLENSINSFTQKVLYDKKSDNEILQNETEVFKFNEEIPEKELENELKMYREATSLFISKQYSKALEIEKDLIQSYPTNAKYYEQIGRTLYALERYEEAIEKYHKAIELEPKNDFYHVGLGDVFLKMKCYDKAKEEYRKAIKLEPKESWHHSKLGDLFAEMACYTKAKEEYYKAIRLEPGESWHYSMLGDVFAEMEHYDEAIEEYYKAIELEPEKSWYYSKLGDIYAKIEHYDEAIAEYHKAIELDPKKAMYYSDLGCVFAEIERYDEAIAEYRKAIVIEPKNALYRSKLGDAFVEIKHYDEAKLEYRKAIKIEPKNALYHSKLGDVFAEIERYDEAIAEYHKAIELEPEEAFYHNNLGDVLVEMKRYDEAAAAYRNAIELDPKVTIYNSKLDKLLLK